MRKKKSIKKNSLLQCVSSFILIDDHYGKKEKRKKKNVFFGASYCPINGGEVIYLYIYIIFFFFSCTVAENAHVFALEKIAHAYNNAIFFIYCMFNGQG